MSGYYNQKSGGGVKIYEEGVLLTGLASSIDFEGAGISGAVVGSAVTETVPAGGDNAQSEVPTGSVNGVNKDFVIAHTPTAGTLKVYLNGARQKVTEDYTLATATISFIVAPPTGSIILCDYSYT